MDHVQALVLRKTESRNYQMIEYTKLERLKDEDTYSMEKLLEEMPSTDIVLGRKLDLNSYLQYVHSFMQGIL